MLSAVNVLLFSRLGLLGIRPLCDFPNHVGGESKGWLLENVRTFYLCQSIGNNKLTCLLCHSSLWTFWPFAIHSEERLCSRMAKNGSFNDVVYEGISAVDYPMCERILPPTFRELKHHQMGNFYLWTVDSVLLYWPSMWKKDELRISLIMWMMM